MFVKVTFITVFVLFLHQGDAIKCYQCSSAIISSCMDEVDAMPMTECTSKIIKEGGKFLKDGAFKVPDLGGKFTQDNVFACAKLVKKDGDQKIVERCCAVRPKLIDVCGQLKDVDFCDYCDTDGCNGSSVLAPSAVLFLLVAALVTLMARQ